MREREIERRGTDTDTEKKTEAGKRLRRDIGRDGGAGRWVEPAVNSNLYELSAGSVKVLEIEMYLFSRFRFLRMLSIFNRTRRRSWSRCPVEHAQTSVEDAQKNNRPKKDLKNDSATLAKKEERKKEDSLPSGSGASLLSPEASLAASIGIGGSTSIIMTSTPGTYVSTASEIKLDKCLCLLTTDDRPNTHHQH